MKRTLLAWLVLSAIFVAGCTTPQEVTAPSSVVPAEVPHRVSRVDVPFHKEGEMNAYLCVGVPVVSAPCIRVVSDGMPSKSVKSQGQPRVIHGNLTRQGYDYPCTLMLSFGVTLPGEWEGEFVERLRGSSSISFSFTVEEYPPGTRFIFSMACPSGGPGGVDALTNMPQAYVLDGRLVEDAREIPEGPLSETQFQKEGEVDPDLCVAVPVLGGPCVVPAIHDPSTHSFDTTGEPVEIRGTLKREADNNPCELGVSLQALRPGADRMEGIDHAEGSSPLTFSFDVQGLPAGTTLTLGISCSFAYYGPVTVSGRLPEGYVLEGVLVERVAGVQP